MQKSIYMMMTESFQPHEGRYLRIYNQAHTLVQAGYDVTIIAWDRECVLEQQVEIDGIKIHRIQIPSPTCKGPRNIGNILKYQKQAIEILLNAKPDCIHCYHLDTIRPGLRAAKVLNCPKILDLCEPNYYRGFWKRRYMWLLPVIEYYEKANIAKFDHVFVHNQYQVDKLRQAGAHRLTQVGSYPNRSLIVEQGRNLSPEKVVIGRLGSIWKNNCIEELLAATENIDSANQHYELFLAGNVFTNYENEYAQLKQRYNDILTNYGSYNIEDISHVYSQIDLSVIIYNKQLFGNITPTKLFESMAHGVPIVANDVGDMSDIIAEGNCGVIVDESDVDSICQGIDEICRDPETYREMSRNCIEMVNSTYCWEANEDKFVSTYNGILGA